MSLASFKDLCLDAAEPAVVGAFWAAALGCGIEVRDDGDIALDGWPIRWIDAVPEPKFVKNRVHLDVRGPAVERLLEIGAILLVDHGSWQVLADPEGNELCLFPGESGSAAPATAFAICVDSAEPVELAAWWHGLLGGEIGPGSDGRPRWLHDGAGLDGLLLKFVPVDDARSVKNRCHWDVLGDVEALVAHGARVLRAQDDEIGWTVMADPQGNEFCAFRPT